MANPHSRNEEILMAIIDGTKYTKKPHSREEYLLIKLKELIETGGGGLTPEQVEALKKEIIKEVLEKTEIIYEHMWFEGDLADWDALTDDEKEKYVYVLFKDKKKIYSYDKDTKTLQEVIDGDDPKPISNADIDDIFNNL